LELISEPLKHVINMSLETGIFPDQLKVAKIISFSRLAIELLKNYERVLYNGLVEFINKLEIFYQLFKNSNDTGEKLRLASECD
jgi:hypothetical protein